MPDPAVRDAITAVYERRMGELADQRTSGAIGDLEWQQTMRQELRDNYLLQIRAGSDGPITDMNDYLKLGSQLRSQYGYLEDFGRAIQAGDVSGGAIASRAKLYARSAEQMYWRQAAGDVELPAYPRDGSSECRTNCGCTWDKQDDGWHWIRSKDDSCDTCVQREQDWNPYTPYGEKSYNPDQSRDERGRWEGGTGGAYRNIAPMGGEVHHMPAAEASTLNPTHGPAIRMDKADHAKTASYGTSREARQYRQEQHRLIVDGKFKEAQQMDVDDLRAKFGNKYDEAIGHMQAYTDKLTFSSRTGMPRNPTPQQARSHREVQQVARV